MDSAKYPGAVYVDLLEQVSDGVYFVNADRRITYWNAGATRITGYRAEEVLGRRCSEGLLRHVDEEGRVLCGSGCPLVAVAADGQPRSAEVYLHHKDGHRVAVTVHGRPLVDPQDRIVGSAEVFQVRANSPYADLERRSTSSSDDPVTGLPLRRMGELYLATLTAAVADGETRLGVAFLDIDRFKSVNDAHGHTVGDRVLRMVGRSMATALRRGDVAVRWGGEEFVALLPGVEGPGLAVAAERIRMLVGSSWLDTSGGRLRVTVSVGATLARVGEAPGQLIERADRLMYQSKRAGGNRVSTDTHP